MAWEKPLSSLFGDMQGTSPVSTPPSTTPTPLPDKKENVFGALDGVSEENKPQATEPVPSSSPSPEPTGLFWEATPKKIETVLEISETLPEVDDVSPLPMTVWDVSIEAQTPQEASVPENISVLSDDASSSLPEVEISLPTTPTLPEEIVPIPETVPVISEDLSLPEIGTSPTETLIPEAPSPETKTESISPTVSEIVPVSELPSEKSVTDQAVKEDPKLAQYLRADSVYQEMIRVDDQEKIRLQIAVRYTLLMFAIFLVFAWIVSNRVIMFGFSEFVWLARIRDALFAVMAWLFSLTLWFGSVSWMKQVYLVALMRTLAIVFFVAVLVALYLPL